MLGLTEEPIDITALVDAVADPTCGALVTFAGMVRDHHEGQRVTGLEYQAYRPMAEKCLAELVEETRARWPEVRVAVLHRIGRLEIGEVSVALAVASPHRVEAYEASRLLIERIKVDLPIWKKEFTEEGVVWVGESM